MSTLNATRGDDFEVSFQWLDASEEPVDLTGYTFQFSTKINRVVTLYDDTPELTITPEEGRIDIWIEEDVTALWSGDGTWKLKYTSPSDEVRTLAKGNIEVA